MFPSPGSPAIFGTATSACAHTHLRSMLGLWVQVTSQPCYQKKHGERARRPGERHTAVEGSKLIARQLRRGHALEEGRDSGIVLAPKVVGDCDRLAMRPRVREPQQREGRSARCSSNCTHTGKGDAGPIIGSTRHRAAEQVQQLFRSVPTVSLAIRVLVRRR